MRSRVHVHFRPHVGWSLVTVAIRATASPESEGQPLEEVSGGLYLLLVCFSSSWACFVVVVGRWAGVSKIPYFSRNLLIIKLIF